MLRCAPWMSTPVVIRSFTLVSCAALPWAAAVASAAPAPPSVPELHETAARTCANMPLRSTGRIYYFCDCQTGAQAGCTAGDDANYAAFSCSAAHPCRTWGQAITAFNAMNAGDTVALCKGGLWNVPAGNTATDAGCGYTPHLPQIENPRCAAGANLLDAANTSTCDIRDYRASWGGTARPVLYAYQTNPTFLIVHGNVHTTNGVRILNLELRGQSQGPGTVGVDHRGLYTSSCAASTQNDWLVCNNDFNHLFLGYQGGDYDTQASTHGAQNRWVIWGNRFTFNELDAILGNVGEHARIDANFFDNNGCWDPPYTALAHSLYLSDQNPTQTGYAWVRGVRVVNNEFRYSTGTPAAPVCVSAPLVGHQYYEGLLIENNIVDTGPGAGGRAWGIGMSAAASGPTSYKDIVVRRNWVRAGGTGIAIGSAPGALVENNIVIAATNTDASGWGTGIDVPTEAARAQDTRSENVTVRNNTVYLANGVHGTRTGILMRQEGSGHVIANNAVYATSGQCWRTLMGHCSITTSRECTPDPNFYDVGLNLAGCPGGETCVQDDRWAFVGNNSCYGGASYDNTPVAQNTVTSNPLFTNPPIDFTPATGSPLLGAGDPTHAAELDFARRTRPSPPSIGGLDPGGVASCTYALGSASASYGSSGGSGSVSVTTEAGCPWTATSNAAWLAVTTAAGIDSGTVTYWVAANAAGPRSATLTIGGETFTVNQAAAGCGYSIAPTAANVAAGGGSGTIAVTTTAACSWTASSSARWLTVTSAPSGTGNGSVAYTVAPNTTGERSAAISVSGQAFTVTQAAGRLSVWHEFFAVNTLETPYVGDFNGDGKADIITFTRQNPLAVGDVYVSLSNGSRFVNRAGQPGSDKWHDWFAISTAETVVIGDYDGDGKDDIATWLGQSTRQVYVALSSGTGMGQEHVWLDRIGSSTGDVLAAGDVTGDGKEDLILFARQQGVVQVAVSSGHGFAAPTQWHGFFAVSTFERPRVADVNGDGKADIVTFATDSPTAFGDVYVSLSDGSKFVDEAGRPNSSTKWHDFFAIRQTEQVRIGDLNGDGKDDFYTFLPPPFGQCYTVVSQGTAMGDNVLWRETVAPLATDRPDVGDADGDGKADVIVFSQGEGKVYVSLAP